MIRPKLEGGVAYLSWPKLCPLNVGLYFEYTMSLNELEMSFLFQRGDWNGAGRNDMLIQTKVQIDKESYDFIKSFVKKLKYKTLVNMFERQYGQRSRKIGKGCANRRG